MSFNLEKTLQEAPSHRNMASLSRAIGIEVGMLRYSLGKARKLDEVKDKMKELRNVKRKKLKQ